MVPVASMPSMSTRPPVGSSNPAMMLKMVVLPQPEGPIRLTKRPCGIASVIGTSAANGPAGVGNVMLTFSTQSLVWDMQTTVTGGGNNAATITQESCHVPMLTLRTCYSAAIL